MASPRAAFVTIGQSPREDILSEMRPWWTTPGASTAASPSESALGLEVEELGILDGIERGEIERLAPTGDEDCLVSRLRDGTGVLLGAHWVEERVQEIVGTVDDRSFDFVVLLCTGWFPGLASKRLLLQPQSIVDHGIAALARGHSRLGVLLPHVNQTRSFRCETVDRGRLIATHASPYGGDRLADAAGELADADVIVMHCMGYTESQRREVLERTGKPVLLARRMVAAAIAQLL
jgi:protein AroM